MSYSPDFIETFVNKKCKIRFVQENEVMELCGAVSSVSEGILLLDDNWIVIGNILDIEELDDSKDKHYEMLNELLLSIQKELGEPIITYRKKDLVLTMKILTMMVEYLHYHSDKIKDTLSLDELKLGGTD